MSIKGFEVGGVQAKYDYESLDNIPANLVQDANYVHTDNNYTNADKTKLSGIEAQANKTTIDATLTQSGQAADAKATGDAISTLNAQVIASLPHDTASGSIASFPDGAAMPVRDLSVAIEPVQSGSGDPSPDNVRPITGWTEATVTRTGKNLYDNNIQLTKDNQQTSITGTDTTLNGFPAKEVTVVGSTTSWGWRIRYKGARDIFKPNTTYTFTWLAKHNNYTQIIGDNGGGAHNLFQQKAATITDIGNGVYRYTATVTTYPADNGAWAYTDQFITPYAQSIAKVEGTYYFSNLIVVVGSVPETEWSAYSGNTYTISWQSEAGTVYGGTLDVTTGKLTVDRAVMSFDGTEAWNVDNQRTNRFFCNTGISNSGNQNDTISNYLKSTEWAIDSFEFGLKANGTLYVMLDRTAAQMTTNEFKSYLASNPLDICYELATPIEVDLTPNTEISTLYGTNNIFADCGDTTVRYYADTTLFVNKKIAAAVAALS